MMSFDQVRVVYDHSVDAHGFHPLTICSGFDGPGVDPNVVPVHLLDQFGGHYPVIRVP
jgi:hypothetical protein